MAATLHESAKDARVECEQSDAWFLPPARPERSNCLDSIPSNSVAQPELCATGRAAAGGLQSVQLLDEAGMDVKQEVLTDSTANLGMHNRIGSGRVRHLDAKWLWTQEAVQAGRFSCKEVFTHSNVSDLTTKHHDEETLERLRYTRRHGDAVSTANEGQTAAVNAVRRSKPIELDKNVLNLWSGTSSLADPGGNERRELGDGRLADKCQEQHTSNALFERGSGNMLI